MASNALTSSDIGAIRVLTHDPSVTSTLIMAIDLLGQRTLYKDGFTCFENWPIRSAVGLPSYPRVKPEYATPPTNDTLIIKYEESGEYVDEGEFSNLCPSNHLGIELVFKDDDIPLDTLFLL